MKRIFVVVLLMLMVVVMPLSISADVDTLFNLAEQYPDETVAFFAMRVDDATIGALDDLAMGLAKRVRGGLSPEDVSLRAALDEMAGELQEGATYDSFIRNWLGDTIAVGVIVDDEFLATVDETTEGDDVPLIWMIEITESAGAEEFIAAAILNSGEVAAPTEADGYTLFEFVEMNYAIAVSDDMVVGGLPRMVTQLVESTPENSFADTDVFNETLELLPADDYATLAFVDQGAILEALSEAEIEDFDIGGSFTGTAGGQAVGLTMEDGRTLAVDIVQQVSDLSSLGFVMPETGVIDAAFAQRIPRSAPILLHSTNLKGIYDALITNASAAEELGAQGDMGTEVIEEGVGALSAATGLDLENDIIGWMTGDYAVFVDFRKDLEEASSLFSVIGSLPLEFGVIIDDSANPEAAARIVDVLADVIEKQALTLAEDEFNTTEIAVTREEISRANALVISVTDTSGNIPFPIEVLVAANDQVFAAGTRASVMAMLSGDGGLTSDPTYTDATSVMVDDPSAVGYIGFPSLLRLVNVINAVADESTGTLVNDILSLFEHWTISGGVDADGNTAARLTITIAAE